MPVKFPFVIMMSSGANASPNRVAEPAPRSTVCASRSFIVYAKWCGPCRLHPREDRVDVGVRDATSCGFPNRKSHAFGSSPTSAISSDKAKSRNGLRASITPRMCAEVRIYASFSATRRKYSRGHELAEAVVAEDVQERLDLALVALDRRELAVEQVGRQLQHDRDLFAGDDRGGAGAEDLERGERRRSTARPTRVGTWRGTAGRRPARRRGTPRSSTGRRPGARGGPSSRRARTSGPCRAARRR